jgi:glycerophosphoryl diester phosphodiesterase
MGTRTSLIVYAHRGVHHGNRKNENTRTAVREALNSSADGLEVDLQPLGDTDFLLHHDDVRPSPDSHQPNLINSYSLKDIQRRFGDELIGLRELLEWDWQGKRFIFECKSSRNNISVVRRLRLLLDEIPTDGSMMLSTSDLELLRRLLIGSTLPVAPVIYDVNPLVLGIIEQFELPEVHLKHTLCTTETIDKLPGIEPSDVIAWTVNTKKQRQKLERLGIKGIMTDNSDLLP